MKIMRKIIDTTFEPCKASQASPGVDAVYWKGMGGGQRRLFLSKGQTNLKNWARYRNSERTQIYLFDTNINTHV